MGCENTSRSLPLITGAYFTVDRAATYVFPTQLRTTARARDVCDYVHARQKHAVFWPASRYIDAPLKQKGPAAMPVETLEVWGTYAHARHKCVWGGLTTPMSPYDASSREGNPRVALGMTKHQGGKQVQGYNRTLIGGSGGSQDKLNPPFNHRVRFLFVYNTLH